VNRLPTVLICLALAACAPSRGGEALSVLRDLAAAETAGTQRFNADFAIDGRAYAADLYRPERPPCAMLVLVPGVTPDGKDDTRLVVFARGIARAGFAVLVPDIASFRAMAVGPGDAQAVADAVTRASQEYVEGADGGVGVVAISYAAGPAMLALLDAATRRRVGFVATIGAYYDSVAVVRFFTTGAWREPGARRWRFGDPDPRGNWVFVRSNLARVADTRDRGRLATMATRKLSDANADVSELARGMGPEGTAILALLDNTEPDRVAALVADLPPAIRADMAALSLAERDLSAFATPVLLVHGRDDPVIPASESTALAQALPPDTAHLYVVDEFAHVGEAGTGAGLGDTVTLWSAVYRLLGLRNAMPAPAVPPYRP